MATTGRSEQLMMILRWKLTHPNDESEMDRPGLQNLRSRLCMNKPASSHPLTLNVLKANSPARSSVAHVGFFDILLDRGVPKASLCEVVQDSVKSEMDELDAALTSNSPMPLRRWMHSRNELWEERNRSGGVQTLAGFPYVREERIVQMLEAGFIPRQDAFLASEVQLMIEDVMNVAHKKFKIPLARSNTLTGIADPTGCLQPGEVHVHFSAPFKDKNAGISWPTLSAMDSLIARNPAMAPWDIQKVRFVFRPELAHLPDMVIMSARGKRSLAELLQEGDFDGDTYWLCWEPKLVSPFKNAFSPWEPPPIEYFGIKKDTRKLRDFVKDPRSETEWCKFFSEMAATRIRFNLLGVVTRLHERLIYLKGGINSKQSTDFVHLHDYLVDADKQGYDFDETDLRHFKEKVELPKNLPMPLHWKFTKIDDEDEDKNPVGAAIVKGNIIDHVFFNIIEPMTQRTIRRVEQILLPARELMDPHLTKFLGQVETFAGRGSVIRDELKAMVKKLDAIRHLWQTKQRSWPFNERVLRLRAQYDLILPRNESHPTIVEWKRRQGNDLTIWEKLKACMLARQHYRTNQRGKLVFLIAGRDLCIIKHHEVGPSHPITEEAWCNYKINSRAKEIKVIAGNDEDDDAGVEEVDDEVPMDQPGYF